MSGYVKLFSSILRSTVWRTPGHVRLVWITMLALADQDGVIEASVPGLSDSAGVTRLECEQALAYFLAPDPDSRTHTAECEGRRIEVVDGGWRLLNHTKYREKMSGPELRAKAAERQRRRRERLALSMSRNVTSNATRDMSRDVTLRHAPSRSVTGSEADQIREEVVVAAPNEKKPEPEPDLVGWQALVHHVPVGAPPLPWRICQETYRAVFREVRGVTRGRPAGDARTFGALADLVAEEARASHREPAAVLSLALSAYFCSEWGSKHDYVPGGLVGGFDRLVQGRP